MRAMEGDVLVVEGRDCDHHARRAQVLEVRAPDGSPPYRVRWLDDQHESLMFPGPDCHLERTL